MGIRINKQMEALPRVLATKIYATQHLTPLPPPSSIPRRKSRITTLIIVKRHACAQMSLGWPLGRHMTVLVLPADLFWHKMARVCSSQPHQNDLLHAFWCEREAHLWLRDNRRMQIPGISCGWWLQIEMRAEEEDQLPADRAQQVEQMHILLCAVTEKKTHGKTFHVHYLTGQDRK